MCAYRVCVDVCVCGVCIFSGKLRITMRMGAYVGPCVFTMTARGVCAYMQYGMIVLCQPMNLWMNVYV